MDQADIDALRAAYDEAPYEPLAHPHSAPGHLAAMAWLFGLDAPEVGSARVLELGCASAGNLIPFAATHPRARAVGVDLSPTQIAQGGRRVAQLGLSNVELHVGDIASLDLDALGRFDYVVAHGVYSWVPSLVQEALLATIARVLSPTGVAYVSYNAYPGWKAKDVVRDAMLLSAERSTTPADRVREARAEVEFLQKVTDPNSVVGRMLADYQAGAAKAGDFYLLHEELEAFNGPCYFRDFAARSAAHGLGYLADAQPEYMFVQNYGPVVGERMLGRYGDGDRLRLEQHLDFVVNRAFRQSLLVHADRTPVVRQQLDHERVRRMHVAAWAPPLPGERFGQHTLSFTTADPGTRAAIEVLNDRWPWTLPYDRLLTDTQARLCAAGVEVAPGLAERVDALLEVLIVQGHARLRLDAVTPLAGGVPIRVDEVVRRFAEATRDDDEALILNSWHEVLPLAPLDRFLVPLLDGRHDRRALIDELMKVFRHNGFRLDHDDGPVLDDAAARELLAVEVDTLPERLSDAKLLDLDAWDQESVAS